MIQTLSFIIEQKEEEKKREKIRAVLLFIKKHVSSTKRAFHMNICVSIVTHSFFPFLEPI